MVYYRLHLKNSKFKFQITNIQSTQIFLIKLEFLKLYNDLYYLKK